MLQIQGLIKRYGERTALAGLTLALPAGQFVALLGPTGAGKSTFFLVLTGLFVDDEGEVEVAGQSLRRSAVRALADIGVVFQQMSLDLDLSVERNLRFHADLHGLPRRVAGERIAEGCRALGLDKDLARPVRELSGGNRRKVELVRALLHRPKVVHHRAVGDASGRGGRGRRPGRRAAQGPAAGRWLAGRGHGGAGRRAARRGLHPRHPHVLNRRQEP